MNKLTLDDFSGGLQELTAAEDFTPRQWSQLKGIVPSSSQVFETQWPVQTIGTGGTNANMRAVFPLSCEAGLFLVAIKTDGTLWWCSAPAHDATFTTANAKTWSQITTAKNVGWASGDSATQPSLSVTANPELRFICAVPLKAYKYIRTPYAGQAAEGGSAAIAADKDNPAKDDENSNYILTGLFSGVLLNTAETNSGTKNSQQVVLFVDTAVYTSHASPTVEAIVFPNYRRFPTRVWDQTDGIDTSDFITAAFLDNNDKVDIDTFPNWPTNMTAMDAPEVKMHPYNWVDIDGTLLPGRGIIPRANVGCMKNEKLILGDIEWRKEFEFTPPVLADVNLSVVGTSAVEITLTDFPSKALTTMGGTIYNQGPGTAYFSNANSVTGGTNWKVRKRKRTKEYPLAASNIVLTAGTPTAGDGSNGDFAYDTVNLLLYGPKAAGAWPATPLTHSIGTGAPSSVGAVNGHYYIDKVSSPTPAATWDVYGPFADTATLTLRSAPTAITVGSTIVVRDVGPRFNGSFLVTAVNSASTPYTVSYVHKGNAIAEKPCKGQVYQGSAFYMKTEVGDTASIPHSWESVYAIADLPDTQLIQKFNVDIAYHYLNDKNTKPFRPGIYFAHEDIDEFDPRSVLAIGKTDVRIAGLHTIDDTIIAITTSGGEADGVYRIRGFLSSIHPYDGSAANPNAVRIELLRGGIGAPQRVLTGGHKNYSCLWRATNTVVFIDRLGGIYYTNGNVVDRIDRLGPRKPNVGVEDDHIAEVGEHLFVYRDGRLLCFSLLGSEGDAGMGAWTELIKPAGTVKSMVGCREDLYFVNGGKVMRYATAGPDAERGRIDNAVQTLTVGTPTIGSQDEHDRTNWHQFGMTFTTPSSCTVQTVQVQSTGSLNVVGGVSLPTVAHTVTLNRTYNTPAVLGEFVVPAGIGPQQALSATVTFTGHVRLESAAFWFTSRTPRRGDQ